MHIPQLKTQQFSNLVLNTSDLEQGTFSRLVAFSFKVVSILSTCLKVKYLDTFDFISSLTSSPLDSSICIVCITIACSKFTNFYGKSFVLF